MKLNIELDITPADYGRILNTLDETASKLRKEAVEALTVNYSMILRDNAFAIVKLRAAILAGFESEYQRALSA